MDKVFKKKNDIPPPPSLPTPSQILDDLKAATSDDPVFYGTSSRNLHKSKGDDKEFRVAQDFMTTTTKLRELEKVLVLQKANLEDSFKELEIMSDKIRQQATAALSGVY